MNTPTAIKNGDIGTISQRVKIREIYKDKKYDGLSALHLATMYDQVEIAEILIQAGANIDLTTELSLIYDLERLSTPLHVAARFNSFRVFQLLMQVGAILTNYDYKTETPLIKAVRNRALEISDLLVQKKAYNLDKEDEMRTLLSLTIEHDNYKVAEALIHSGAKTDYILEGRKSLLILAVEKKNSDFVDLLLKANADVNYSYEADGYIKTALYEAIRCASAEIVEKLIDADAEVNLCVRAETSRKLGKRMFIDDKVTLLSLAIDLKLPVIIKTLIGAGADFNSKFYDSGALFYKVLREGNMEIFQVMLECGVTKDQLDYALKWSSSVVQLVKDTVESRIIANKYILEKFILYLTSDKSCALSFPKDVALLTAEFAADSEIILSRQWCDNYIKYHPVNEHGQ